MSKLPGAFTGLTPWYDFSGTIASGGTAQLVLPIQPTRFRLVFQNISDTDMMLGFAGATATATVTSNAVASIAVNNAGLGFSYPPSVMIIGGGRVGAEPDQIVSGLGFPGPTQTAVAHAVMTGSAPNQTVASIAVDLGGGGYDGVPYVYLQNNPRDPFGAFAPSATVGVQIYPGGSYFDDIEVCSTDQLSVFCATTGKAFTCKVMVA